MITEAPFGRGVVEILGDSDINPGAEHEFVRFGGIFRQVMETLTLDNSTLIVADMVSMERFDQVTATKKVPAAELVCRCFYPLG